MVVCTFLFHQVRRPKQGDDLNPGVQSQPRQHSKTDSKKKVKYILQQNKHSECSELIV